MSYASRGPGRPPQDSGNAQGAPASVGAARDRLAAEQQRRQAPLRSQLPYPQFETNSNSSPRSQYALKAAREQQSLQWPGRKDRLLPPAVTRPGDPIGAPPQVAPPPLPELPGSDVGLTYLSAQSHSNSRSPVEQTPAASVEHTARQLRTFSQSSNTSLGSIPDFPVSVNTNLPGQQPPSNSRRGYSARNSQFSSPVAPIREESRKSYASSAVISSAMARGPDIYYVQPSPSDDDEASTPRRISPGPVRTASVGRRGKPSVLSIRSSKARDTREFKEIVPSASLEALVPQLVSPGLDRPASVAIGGQNSRRASRQRDSYLQVLENPSRKSRVSFLKQTQRSGLSDRVGSKVPPPLNVNAVRDAEVRGSLTSLPDLIRRATKLAANLDRGKTASRLGLDWMTVGDVDNLEKADAEKGTGNPELDDSVQTGTTLQNPTSEHEQHSPSEKRDRDRDRDRARRSSRHPSKKKKRRCCGMERNCFIGVVLLLTLLIAAAVVIPVTLIVLPKLHKASSASPVAAYGDCASMTCSNGGTSATLPGGTCVCICNSGYSGTLCKDSPEPACTTIDTAVDHTATVGTLIPPLLQTAKDLSIPLMDDVLIERFAEFNMTCPVANALVTFPSMQNKRELLSDAGIERRLAPAAASTTAAAMAAKATGAAQAESQLIIGATNDTTNDFARVGILFVLQDSDSLAVTQTAQQNVYSFLVSASRKQATVSDARNVTLGNGYILDLWYYTVTLRNGTVYGQGWNGTALKATR
jgi:hypothetical protein